MEEINNIDINETKTETTEQESKTYTAEEVQSMIDRAVQRGVETNSKKLKREFDKQLSLSKLDESARAQAEKDDEIASLREQLAAFQVEKNRSELKSVLSNRGLSAEFADIINISDDMETSQSNIDKLDKLFKAAVKAEVEKRLAGNAPARGATTAKTYTKEDIKNMSILELQNLKNTNPELYRQLMA